MNVLEDLPPALLSVAVAVDPDQPDKMAWDRQDALSVIQALEGTKVGVASIDVYRTVAWGPVATGDHWIVERSPGELGTELSARSRREAREYLESCEERSGDLYSVELSGQDDAA